MSVYTELDRIAVEEILQSYPLGKLHDFTGIAAGIENTNFFINCDHGRFVLTLFERMNAVELPYFMRLMNHLAERGLNSPTVQTRHDGSLLFAYAKKQGCIVSALAGETLEFLNTAQLRASGEAMAQLHLAGADFGERRNSPTDLKWLQTQITVISSGTQQKYGDEAVRLLEDELLFQQLSDWHNLPHGIIHGDLFCDNILFEGDEVSGIIDFYYAHDSAYTLDIAIALNAQAITCSPYDELRVQAFIGGYEKVRTLQSDEKTALPTLIRLAALRFWVSRLYDAFNPRAGAIIQVKDPEEYRLKLLQARSEKVLP